MQTPPKYVMLVVYPENVTDEHIKNILDNFGCPYYVSCLHTPEGRKEHKHIIIDMTETENTVEDLNKICLFLKTSTGKPFEPVRNIYRAELYMRHRTADSSNKQQFTDDELNTEIFGRGYVIHERTYSASRDVVSLIISYVSYKIIMYIDDGNPYNTRIGVRLVLSNEFWNDFKEGVDVSICMAKALNEVKTHYRFYNEYKQDFDNNNSEYNAKREMLKTEEQREKLCEDVKTSADYVCDYLPTLGEQTIHSLFYALYTNYNVFHDVIIKEFGSPCNCGNKLEFLKSYIRGRTNNTHILHDDVQAVLNWVIRNNYNVAL